MAQLTPRMLALPRHLSSCSVSAVKRIIYHSLGGRSGLATSVIFKRGLSTRKYDNNGRTGADNNGRTGSDWNAHRPDSPTPPQHHHQHHENVLLDLAQSEGRTRIKQSEALFALQISSRTQQWDLGLACLAKASRPWQPSLESGLSSFLQQAQKHGMNHIVLQTVQLCKSLKQGDDQELMERGIHSAIALNQWKVALKFFLTLLEQGTCPSPGAFKSIFQGLAAQLQWQAILSLYDRVTAIDDDPSTVIQRLAPCIKHVAAAHAHLGRPMEGAKLVNSFINEMKIDRAIGFRMRAPAIQMFATMQEWEAAMYLIDASRQRGESFAGMRLPVYEAAIQAMINTGRGAKEVLSIVKKGIRNPKNKIKVLENFLTSSSSSSSLDDAKLFIEAILPDAEERNRQIVFLIDRCVGSRGSIHDEQQPKPSTVIDPVVLLTFGMELGTSMGEAMDAATRTKLIVLARRLERPGDCTRALYEAEALGIDLPPLAYAVTVDALGMAGHWEAAVKVHQVTMTKKSYSAAVKACALAGQWQETLSLVKDMEANGFVENDAISLWVYKHLFEALSKAGAWTDVLDVFRGLGNEDRPKADMYCYHHALRACGRVGAWKEGLELVKTMKKEGMEPDAFVYSMVLSACRRGEGGWAMADKVIQEMERNNKASADTYLQILMAKARKEEAAQPDPKEIMRIIQKMLDQNPTKLRFYEQAFFAMGSCGLWSESISLLDDLLSKSKQEPNLVCFRTVIKTCQEAGQSGVCLDVLRTALQYYPPDLNMYMSTLKALSNARGGDSGRSAGAVRLQCKNIIKSMIETNATAAGAASQSDPWKAETKLWLSHALESLSASKDWEAAGWLLDEAMGRWSFDTLRTCFDVQVIATACVEAREAGKMDLADRLAEFGEGGGTEGNGEQIPSSVMMMHGDDMVSSSHHDMEDDDMFDHHHHLLADSRVA